MGQMRLATERNMSMATWQELWPTPTQKLQADDFNNHDIIQKAVPLTKIMLKDLRQNPRNTSRLEAVEKASNNIDDIFYEIGKFGGKKQKNNSRKVKKSRRTKKSLKTRRTKKHAKKSRKIKK